MSACVDSCNFSQFVVSLGSSAMVNLGLVADPTGGTPDLALAKHSHSLLMMLREKTKGNLDGDEQRLLEALINEIGGKLASGR
jgi:hypothetical protein